MNVTETHCRCNGAGAIGHGGTTLDHGSLEICGCSGLTLDERLARAVCHALRHLSPTPELQASGRCPTLFERKDLP
jgi:hypothetical protein